MHMTKLTESKDYFTLMGEILGNAKLDTQENLLKKLTEWGYVMLPPKFIQETSGVEIKPDHITIPFMVKRIKHSNRPAKDIYDFDFMVGIDYYAKSTTAIPLYIRGNYLGDHELPWGSTHVNFRVKKDPTVFPSYLSHKERRQWRIERQRFLKKGEATEFYLEHLPAVAELNPNMEF